ncbi:hypothetical protein AWC38_SpisGene7776 [Stylophora pistillata]|uniref:Uncharacterized protein n=1 Tax=Stylophora pistillata TaxID=50429 RepID=A0A2B4SER7_STYPI|nr:hypothetical protein AWC38_SpisGene7776 [Stylophora pistillata]
MNEASHGQEDRHSGAFIPPQESQTSSGEGNVHPTALVQQIFNNPEALTLLRRAFHQDPVIGDDSAAKSNSNSAGASKAQTAHDTFSPAAKRPRNGENPSDENLILEPGISDSSQHTSHPSGDDEDEDEFCHSARWQTSEELSSFLGTLHKPLSAFERKAITRKYPRPDVDSIYTPALDNYLPSLVPGIKTADKDLTFWQDHVLDTLGPISMLFEHNYSFLAEAKPSENVTLSFEQLKDFGAVSSNAIRLLGNASALLSKERCKTVLNKINPMALCPLLPLRSSPRLAKIYLGMVLRQGVKPDQKQQKLCFKLLQRGTPPDVLSYFEAAPPLSEDWGTAGVDLSQKLGFLLALTAMERVSEIVSHDLRYRRYLPKGVSFQLPDLTKKSSVGQNLKTSFHAGFQDNSNLCVVKCVKESETRTLRFRPSDPSQPNKLVLSYIRPHKPISSASLSRWLKDLISRAVKEIKSCKEHYDVHMSNVSQLVTLHIGAGPTSVLSHMGDFGCGVGGWTAVKKIHGNKVINTLTTPTTTPSLMKTSLNDDWDDDNDEDSDDDDDDDDGKEDDDNGDEADYDDNDDGDDSIYLKKGNRFLREMIRD